MVSSHRQLHQRTYRVSKLQVVEPQDVTLLVPTSQDTLTLITCYPFGRSPRSPQRFIVRALPVEENGMAQNNDSVK
jgi:sortase A